MNAKPAMRSTATGELARNTGVISANGNIPAQMRSSIDLRARECTTTYTRFQVSGLAMMKAAPIANVTRALRQNRTIGCTVLGNQKNCLKIFFFEILKRERVTGGCARDA